MVKIAIRHRCTRVVNPWGRYLPIRSFSKNFMRRVPIRCFQKFKKTSLLLLQIHQQVFSEYFSGDVLYPFMCAALELLEGITQSIM